MKRHSPYLTESYGGSKKSGRIFLLVLFGLILLGVLAAGWWNGRTSPLGPIAHGKYVDKFTLSNGMRVIVVPNHMVPAVAHMVWYDVGAADDPPAKSGIAHFFEHMMFRGTKNTKPGEFSRHISELGGADNAFTGHDYTAYHQKIAKEHLPELMRLEADRMQNLLFDENEVKREREVIIEERHQEIESDIGRLFDEQFDAEFFYNHPYQRPVIGWEHEMQTLNRDDLLQFYTRYVHPSNAVLVVGGDITAEELQPLAEETYGRIPAGEKPVRPEWKEPPYHTSSTLEMRHPLVRQPMWMRAYHAPTLSDVAARKECFALMILAALMDNEGSGRLYNALVNESKMAISVRSSYGAMSRGPGQFSLTIVPAPGASMEKIAEVVEQVLKKEGSEPVAQTDLERIKRLYKASVIYSQEGLMTLPRLAGMLEIMGIGSDYLDSWEANIDAVTAEDVMNAAKKIFEGKGPKTGVLLPVEGLPEQQMPAASEVEGAKQ